MDRTANIASQDARYKMQAQNHLVELKRILRHLSADRVRSRNRGAGQHKLTSEVKAILHGT